MYPDIQIVREKFMETIQNEKTVLIINEYSNEIINNNLFVLLACPYEWSSQNPYRALFVRDIEQVNVLKHCFKCDGFKYSLYGLQNKNDKYSLMYINTDNTRKITDEYHFGVIRVLIENFLNLLDNRHINIKYFQKRGGPF
jgi:hypothetical protein